MEKEGNEEEEMEKEEAEKLKPKLSHLPLEGVERSGFEESCCLCVSMSKYIKCSVIGGENVHFSIISFFHNP